MQGIILVKVLQQIKIMVPLGLPLVMLLQFKENMTRQVTYSFFYASWPLSIAYCSPLFLL
jgi:hypothetical protein